MFSFFIKGFTCLGGQNPEPGDAFLGVVNNLYVHRLAFELAGHEHDVVTRLLFHAGAQLL